MRNKFGASALIGLSIGSIIEFSTQNNYPGLALAFMALFCGIGTGFVAIKKERKANEK
jgi:hypothetical protein